MADAIKPVIEFEQVDFDFVDLEEELRVDERCRTLLNRFYADLLSRGFDEQHASDLAFCTDFYLRDYLLDFYRQNVVRPKPGIIRYFAGNWFIIKTLDPDMAVLEKHLEAIAELYRFIQRQHYISVQELDYLLDETRQTGFYRQRIDSFLSILGDGYIAWNAECTMEE